MTFENLLTTYNITPEFPAKVIYQANSLGNEVKPEDLKGRLDLTDLDIMTIDGDDAKDFDDAISVEMTEDGFYQLGVHIADVSHYVTENSAIDKSAFDRGTSVYLIDKVVPMLPFELSNELCSLKPNVVRLTVSVFMDIDDYGNVRSYKIANSFIKSKNRMTYDKVTKIIEGDKELRLEYADIVDDIMLMKKLAGILNKRRVKRGAIEFVTQESKITLDEKGRPIKIEPYPITVSNNIIEEFMLICNETVAKHLYKRNIPLVYRVHEKPSPEKIQNLSEVMSALGYEFKFKIDVTPIDIQCLLKQVKDTPVEKIVNSIALRSMSKARYHDRNLGHFGLASKYYCHFTSPIRRYPDLVVHRILKETLKGEISEKRLDYLKELTNAASITSSATEVNAADAEFEWKEVKMAEYMSEHIGEEFDGNISHIVNSGFFVELDSTVEGFVPARLIEDDMYTMSDNQISFIGMKTGRVFMVGDRVRIKVYGVDLENSDIDFELVSSESVRIKSDEDKHSRSKKKKYNLNRDEQKRLKKMRTEAKERRSFKRTAYEKLNFELGVFRKTVAKEVSACVFKHKELIQADRMYVNVNVKNMVYSVSLPVSDLIDKTISKSEKISEITGFETESYERNAKFRTVQTLTAVNEALEIGMSDEEMERVGSRVAKCIRILARSIPKRENMRTKREGQYMRVFNLGGNEPTGRKD